MDSTKATWTKGRNGDWLVRIPANMWRNYEEAGENEFTVHKRNGETQIVRIERVSKPFLIETAEYVLGTPAREKRTYVRTGRTYGSYRRGSRRCEECGSTRNVHKAHDMSGLSCWLCDNCDDGSASIM